MGFPGGSVVKNLPAKREMPRSEIYPGGENGNPLQHSCLENSTDRGACQAPWLQSPSAVILEPPQIKSDTVSPSISHEVMGPDTMILVF